ncbi:MAG: hypothetical protein M3167_06325 [Acidobacteriota bacterium]|nr:hypothetical protein [Acidobacteriota bacterium]MDQ6892280.1 hypothetical protein [Acidobacteriota bacterium]
MADGPETKIAKAFAARIRGSARVVARYVNGIVLTEGVPAKYAFTSETLVLAAFPVKPAEQPSRVENIYVDMLVCPVLQFEQTDTDSILDAANEFNEFRKLLFSGRLQLTEDLIGGSSSVNLTDPILSFDWPRTTIPPAATSLRIPEFRARYSSKIMPATGDYA